MLRVDDVLPDHVEYDETSETKNGSDVVDLSVFIHRCLFWEEIGQDGRQDGRRSSLQR